LGSLYYIIQWQCTIKDIHSFSPHRCWNRRTNNLAIPHSTLEATRIYNLRGACDSSSSAEVLQCMHRYNCEGLKQLCNLHSTEYSLNILIVLLREKGSLSVGVSWLSFREIGMLGWDCTSNCVCMRVAQGYFVKRCLQYFCHPLFEAQAQPVLCPYFDPLWFLQKLAIKLQRSLKNKFLATDYSVATERRFSFSPRDIFRCCWRNTELLLTPANFIKVCFIFQSCTNFVYCTTYFDISLKRKFGAKLSQHFKSCWKIFTINISL